MAASSGAGVVVTDGLPCRPYVMGEHARMLARMLVIRLVIAAVVAGILTPILAIGIELAVALNGEGAPPAQPFTGIAAGIGSPLALGAILILVDYLLIRGRLAPAASLLTWAGRQEAAFLRSATSLRRPTDVSAARAWLAAHPDPTAEDTATTQARVHLQLLAGDVAAARRTIGRLPTDDPAGAATVSLLQAQSNLALGEPFDPAAIGALVSLVPDDELQAVMQVDLAALIAQARSTCRGMDTLEPVLAVRALVGGPDRGIMLISYWAPMAILVLAMSLALLFLFPG